MALQIWLPLNKENELTSQGLMNNIFSKASSPVFSASGKIGGCYSFDGVDDALYSETDKVTYWNGKAISFACWFKCDKTKSRGNLIEIGADLCLTYLYNTSGVKFGYWRCYSNNGSRVGDSTTDPNYYSSDVWHHVVVTFDHLYNKIYIDGNLSSEYDRSNKYTINWSAMLSNTYKFIAISKSYGDGTAYTGGLINDVRIYDHCLSPKEVKEISKSLVLHYPLNIFPKKDNLITFDLSTSNYNISNYASRTSGSITNGVYHTDGYQYSTSIDTAFYVTSKTYLTLSSNTDYYLSFYCKCKNAVSVYFHNNYNYVNTGFLDNSSKYYGAVELVDIGTEYNGYVILKLHTGDSTLYKISLGFDIPNLYGIDSYIEFSQLRLTAERPTELELGILVFGDNIIYDCSGYQNNATTNGTILSSLNSPRYDYCVKYPNSACSIGIGNLSTIVPKKVFTFNIWFKKVTGEWSSKGWETIFGGPGGFEVEAKRSSTNSPKIVIYNWGGSSDSTKDIPYDLDVWNMLTMVRTTSNTKFYLNGELKVTGTAGSVPSGNYFIGSWSTATSLNYRGYFSDARIYATVLSDVDILELYNTSAIIDDHGNSYCYLFTDNSELGEFTKLGIGKFDLIEDKQGQSSIYKQVNPNLLSNTSAGIPKKTMTTSTTEFGTFFNPTELLLTNVNYTISMKIRGTAPMCIYTINTGGNLRFDLANRTLMNSTNYELKRCTFKVTGDRTINLIYICTKYGDTLSGEWFEVEPYSIKLEEGNTCTPWIPAETDDMYRSYGKTLLSNELIEI